MNKASETYGIPSSVPTYKVTMEVPEGGKRENGEERISEE